jgi:hypothetical protein
VLGPYCIAGPNGADQHNLCAIVLDTAPHTSVLDDMAPRYGYNAGTYRLAGARGAARYNLVAKVADAEPSSNLGVT